MKENKGEQPEREIKSILKKYEKYVSNIEWHIRVNKPPEEEIKKLNAQIEYYNEMISDLNGIAAQPSKVQEELKKENELLEAREVAWQNKHSFLMEEIKELKAWQESAISVMPDMQAIGKALNVPLGQSVHDKILPGIERLKDALKSRDILQEEDRHEIQRLKASKENEGKPKEGITKEQIIKVMRNSEESLNRNVGMGCNYETYLLPPDYTLVARKILQLIALNEGKQAGDVFVKASERLPDNPNPKQRVFIKNDGRRDVMVYIVDWESKKGNWCWSLAFNDSKGKMISKKEFEKIEWLDENNI